MISRRKAKKWKTLDAWGKNMSIREYINSKIDEIYDGVDKLKAELKAKDERTAELEEKFCQYLCHTTQSRISKEYGTAEEMIAVFEAVQEELISKILLENSAPTHNAIISALKERIAELEKEVSLQGWKETALVL